MRSALALLCACTISAQSFSSSVLTLQAKEDPAVQEESRTPKPMPSMPERPEETTDSEESAEQDLAPEARESATSEEDSPEKADQKGDSADADSSSAVLKTDAQTDWTGSPPKRKAAFCIVCTIPAAVNIFTPVQRMSGMC